MKLTEIFTAEKLSANDKVAAIAKVVESARTKYGNTDADIEAPEICTIDGVEDLSLISAEGKVALAESEVTNIKIVATEFVKSYDGAIFSRKVEELIAISPLLANIGIASPENDYI